MNELKRFVELKFNQSDIAILIALEDIVSVVEEMHCQGNEESFKEYKAIRITTIQRDSHLCDYSNYAMLKHYLSSWEELPRFIEQALKEKNHD